MLKRNSKKLQVDPARREPGEALQAEFEGSMGKLAPLRERTLEDGRTDRCDGVQALRADGRGDRQRKRCNGLIMMVQAIVLPLISAKKQSAGMNANDIREQVPEKLKSIAYSYIQPKLTKYPSQPDVEGSPDRLARFTARGIPSEAVARKNLNSFQARSPRKPDIGERPTPAPERPRLGAEPPRPTSRSMGKLGPLRERIRQTDELIDAMV